MIVYLVIYGHENWPVGVFSTLKLAEEYIAERRKKTRANMSVLPFKIDQLGVLDSTAQSGEDGAQNVQNQA